MRILLDECVNPRLRQAFTDHSVAMVADLGWRALSDRSLVAEAQGRFDVLVTIDRGFEFQQNLSKVTFGIVIVHVEKNRVECYRPLFQALMAAVETVRPGEVLHVGNT